MIVYKIVDEFSRETGKKLGTRRVFDHQICDFTGEKITEHQNPNTYNLDFQDNDPCFGDSKGEKWLYEWDKEIDAYQLFGCNQYIFKTNNGNEVFSEMIKCAQKELDNI